MGRRRYAVIQPAAVAEPKREKAFSLRVTADDHDLIEQAVAAVNDHARKAGLEEPSRSATIRRALRIGLAVLLDSPGAQPPPEKPRRKGK